MDISRIPGDGAITLVITGRLDGSWADHFDASVAEVIREGHHDLRIDLSAVVFLSSAGIGVLVKNYQKLAAIGGSLVVVNPSPAVERVLRIGHLAEPLMHPARKAAPAPAAVSGPILLTRSEAAFEAFHIDPGAALEAEVVADDWQMPPGAAEARDVCLGSRAPLFAVAVGAFGSSAADCRGRYGELLSVAGGTACQPTDGTNAPDFLLSADGMPSDVRILHGILCGGRLSHLVRFEPAAAGATVGLGAILDACRQVTAADRAGVVIIAEAEGLVGASLRQSPAAVPAAGFFEHPGVRSRLTFTAEPAFARTLVVAAGVIATPEAAEGLRQLRPIAPGLVGHVHAAAFGFRVLKKGRLDLKATIATVFEEEPLVGVLHLLRDDRIDGGAGESQFIRGACWTAPIHGAWRRTS